MERDSGYTCDSTWEPSCSFVPAKECVDPFSVSAVELFRHHMQVLLTRDLKMEPGFALAFAEQAATRFLRDGISAFPQLAHDLEASGVRQRWNAVFWENRSKCLTDWVRPHITGTLLDLLCGDGRVGERLGQFGLEVTLTERDGAYDCDRQHVMRYVPFHDVNGDFSQRFDTVLLCTVLHHEKDPDALLSLGAQLGRQRLIIVENCLEDQYPADYHLLVDLFFNHCLNRIVVDCPLSHRSIDHWLASASQYGTARELGWSNMVPGIPLGHHLIELELEAS